MDKYYAIFIRFLKENKCFYNYSELIFNFINNGIKIFPSNFVLSAFDWSENKRGLNYWTIIHVKWRLFLCFKYMRDGYPTNEKYDSFDMFKNALIGDITYLKLWNCNLVLSPKINYDKIIELLL